MRLRLHALALCLLVAGATAGPLLTSQPHTESKDGTAAVSVLVVGDGWAEAVATQLPPLTKLLDNFSVNISSLAQVGATSLDLRLSTVEVLYAIEVANADAIVITIGANDLLGYYAIIGNEVYGNVANNLNVFISSVLAVFPHLEVVIVSYDYPNYVQSDHCRHQAEYFFGTDVTKDLNELWLGLNSTYNTVVSEFVSYANISYVAQFGLMQTLNGSIPHSPNASFPTPKDVMADCIHLTDAGFHVFTGNTLDVLFDEVVDSKPSSAVPSQLSYSSTWSSTYMAVGGGGAKRWGGGKRKGESERAHNKATFARSGGGGGGGRSAMPWEVPADTPVAGKSVGVDQAM